MTNLNANQLIKVAMAFAFNEEVMPDDLASEMSDKWMAENGHSWNAKMETVPDTMSILKPVEQHAPIAIVKRCFVV